jgi:hypothetical protein
MCPLGIRTMIHTLKNVSPLLSHLAAGHVGITCREGLGVLHLKVLIVRFILESLGETLP